MAKLTIARFQRLLEALDVSPGFEARSLFVAAPAKDAQRVNVVDAKR